MSHRLAQLESSLQYHQFIHDVNEELNWIRERAHQSASTDLGTNLTGVQQLLAKHQARQDYNTSSHKLSKRDCFTCSLSHNRHSQLS